LSAAANPPIPPGLAGVWQRTLLEGPGIERDTQSTVIWLQTERWHGDLRLPPHRPDFRGCSCVADCSPEQQHWLAGQQGFAGITEVHSMVCQWHRKIDYQPPSGRRDIGSLAFSEDGATLQEHGIDAQYHETWQRLPGSVGPSFAWRRVDPGPMELLLIAQGYFLYVRDRPQPITGAPNLRSLLAQTPASAPQLLDLELSFGQRSAASTGWLISGSTLPWREGQTLELKGEWTGCE
jgi:hypothetical protein